MPNPDHVVRQGDSGGLIEAVLMDADGVAVSISAATVRFTMAPLSGGLAVLAAQADNLQDDSLPDTIGHASYEWTSTDTAVPGHYLAEWEVTFPDNSVITFPNDGYVYVQITGQLAPNEVV
jgi:hypothetical protein